MWRPRQGILVLVWAVVLQCGPLACNAEIRHTAIRSDSRGIIVFQRFGFDNNGRVEIGVSEVAMHSTRVNAKPPVPSRMGFFFTSEAELVQILMDVERQREFCVLDSHRVRLIFTLDKVHPVFRNYSRQIAVPVAEEYGVFFANCEPGVRVTMNVRTSMYNVDYQQHKDYLGLGEAPLPVLYAVFALVYTAAVGLWAYVLRKQGSLVHKIHGLMMLVVVLKAVNLVAEAADLHFTRRTGTPHGWDVVFYLSSFLRGVATFSVIVLIGTGWSILKPFLQDREKKVLMVVIPLQVLANLAAIAMDEAGPSARDWMTWRQIFMLVDIICCCTVLFPIVWSIKHLREASRSDGKAARNLVKLTLFRQYYLVVVCYIYFTRIVVFALTAASDFRYQWVASLARECATFGFYVFTGYKFRPAERNPYISVDEQEEEESAAAIAAADELEL